MIGIYKITNLSTGQCYIGQSKDLKQREYQHWHDNQSSIDKAISENPNNFKFEILEECSIEELTEKETFYIAKYNSASESNYNCAIGGCSRPGYKNSNCKLDLLDIIMIRSAYDNHTNKHEIYEKVKHKVSWRGFEKVWNKETWPDVLPDVYTEENKDYYKHGAKSVPQEKTFTDEEVMEFRKRYVNETGRQIYESIGGRNRCVYETLESALIGLSFTHLPVYRKKDKKWVNL